MFGRDIQNGRPLSGCSSSGGGIAAPQAWQTALDLDFTTMTETDLLTGGDGAKTIAGKTWELLNSTEATAVGVGSTSGGLKITADPVNAYSFCHSFPTRTSTMMRVPLRELLGGTLAAGRDDIEIQLSYMVVAGGGPSAYQYEGFAHGLDPKNNTQQSGGTWAWSGWWDNNPTRMRPILLGTDAGGLTEQTNAEVSVFPNAYRWTFREGRVRKAERNGNNTDTSLSAVTWTPVKWALASTTELFSLIEGAANELAFFFALDNYAGGGAFTSITLQKMRLEWRPSLTASLLWLA